MKTDIQPKDTTKKFPPPNKNFFYPSQNRTPLLAKPFLELPIGAIKANGWLGTQLYVMKQGMTGNLDNLYRKVVGDRNGWLGGDGDVWERGPYWLDGLVPLAYILNDEGLINKAKPWIEWAINSQRDDGYFGPRPLETAPIPEVGLQKDKAADWWPRMVMLKVLKQYYSATGDKRVIQLMTKYFHFQLKELPKTPLDNWGWWGAQRGGDNLMIVYWLYNITEDPSLLELAKLIHKQTFNWTKTFLNSDKLSRLFSFHGVNLAQGIKEPVIYYQQDPDKKYIEAVNKAFKDIHRFIGQPQGMYGADELTHTNEPTQGSELCSAVEMMFSLENMISITGDVKFMDHLEKIAFNALPTQISDDYMTRQYYQQANQVIISRHPRNFVTAHDGTDQCFGLLTGYPCCTCNMHQGWPKFTQNLWMATEDGGIAALVYAPSSVKMRTINGISIQFIEETNYPFDDVIHFVYKGEGQGEKFPFHLRIPSWCREASILLNGEILRKVTGGQVIKINRNWNALDKITLTLPMHITFEHWNGNSISVERGPLVYGLKISEDWSKIDNEDHYGTFYEVYPTSKWNYGLIDVPNNKISEEFKVIKKGKVSDTPWNLKNAPIEIEATAVQLPQWKLYNENTGPLPFSPQPMPTGQKPVTVTLIPYGCTTLRVSEFPLVRP